MQIATDENTQEITIGMKNITVIYHGDCMDGFGAAWSAYKLFGDEAQYIPGQPGQSPPEGLPEGSALYLVDIAYPPGVLNHLAAKFDKVVIIDHHETTKGWFESYDPPENVEIVMDMEHSGAVLAWRYFHKEKKLPKLLAYIEDRDLWKWELQDSEAILLAVDAYPYTFGNMDRLMDDIERLKLEGQAILKYRNQMLDLQLKAAHLTEFRLENERHVVPAVNCSLRALVSEACHELLQKFPDAAFVVAYRRGSDGDWYYSLRSRGEFDVAAFAAAYAKGGGHKAAAGMTTREPPTIVFDD